ncbi:MAG: response regulator [Rhodospirillales bacterium]|nr:response regulator [Rhodospirillales bacterium]
MQVLYVDDDPSMTMTVQLMLRAAGHSCDTTDLGERAVTLARTLDYDAIILDIMLPDIDGYEVIERLREAEVKTPLLIQTGLVDRSQPEDSQAFGANDILIKPFGKDELIEHLERIVSNGLGALTAPPAEDDDVLLLTDLVEDEPEAILTPEEPGEAPAEAAPEEELVEATPEEFLAPEELGEELTEAAPEEILATEEPEEQHAEETPAGQAAEPAAFAALDDEPALEAPVDLPTDEGPDEGPIEASEETSGTEASDQDYETDVDVPGVPAPEEAARQKRTHSRVKAIKPCEIEFDGTKTRAMVLNLSPGGAAVRLPRHMTNCPKYFTLKFAAGRSYECRVCWRVQDKVGVAFL